MGQTAKMPTFVVKNRCAVANNQHAHARLREGMAKRMEGGSALRTGIGGVLAVAVVLIGISLWGCGPRPVVRCAWQAPVEGWSADSVVGWAVKVTDISEPYTIDLGLRHSSSYDFSNLYLIVTIQGPDGAQVVDTLSYPLANALGEWYGKGFADTKELILPYRRNAQFADTGEYRFTLRHGMRQDPLEGIKQLSLELYKGQSPREDGEE